MWCTYIGGSGDDSPRGGLTLDEQDNVYVVGTTASSNFPTTVGAFQRNLRGTNDAALVKVKMDGSGVVFSTLLGGSGSDGTIMGVRVDASGNVYLAGHTESADFPVTANAAQARLGGQSDCFFAEFSSAASSLVYSTYLGGSQNEFAEHQPWLAPEGTMLLTGSVSSPDFPSTNGAFQRLLKGTSDGFLTKLSAYGRTFIFSTFVGGSGGDFFLMPTVDAQGNIFMVGQTGSQDFPVTADSFQATYGGGQSDGAMAVFSPDGTKLIYATYLGGSGEEMIRSLTLGPNGEVYVVGSTSSSDFPVTSNAAQTHPGGKEDAFVVKLMPRAVGDSDSDGLPDEWEKHYFGSTAACLPNSDPDGDGLTNVQECAAGTDPQQSDTDGDWKSDGAELLAGTDPLDSKSVFSITGLTYSQPGVRIDWSVVSGRAYQAHSSNDFDTWAPCGEIQFATSQDTFLSIMDAGSSGLLRRFYRVEVLP